MPSLPRWAKRLFHRSDKKRPYHSTSDQQSGTGTNAIKQNTAPISPLKTGSHQPSNTPDAQTSSAKEDHAPFSGEKKTSASPQHSRNEIHDSQPADASVSNNQPQSLRRQPQGTQEGYLKPALKRKAINGTLPQGSSYTPPSEPPHRKPPLGDSSIRDGEEKAQSRDEHANGLVTAGSDTNNDGVGHHGHHEVYIDRSVHPRPAAVQEEIKPHIHTVYEPRRTRSIHLHEHRTLIQPIVDPAPK